MAELVDEIQLHGFIQAILMRGRWYKKTQSSNQVFKLNLHFLKQKTKKKHIGFELAANINHLTRSLLF